MKTSSSRVRAVIGDHLNALACVLRHAFKCEKSLPSILISTLSLFFWKKFSLQEIVGYALFDAAVRAQVPLLISKNSSLAKLARINPVILQQHLEDKWQFYLEAKAFDLPVPKHYALLMSVDGYDQENREINDRSTFLRHLHQTLPQEFIAKDRCGVHGSGFSAFKRVGDRYAQVHGECLSIQELYDLLSSGSHRGTIVQERLRNHPEIQAWSSGEGLSTLRVVTVLSENRVPKLLFYLLRVSVGSNLVDNFSMGVTGNLIAYGDKHEGVLRGARVMSSSGVGLTTIVIHPVTQSRIDGFPIPLWRDAVDLALRAHSCFIGFGALGWDIALTPEGPTLLEGNPWWDPPTYAPWLMEPREWEMLFA